MNSVQKLRQQTGITQQELAAMGGTSQSTIAAYERGAKSPTLRTLENLARSQNLEMVVNYIPRMTREDRRSLAFHRAIVKRLRKDPAIVPDLIQVNLEKLIKMHPGAGSLFKQWLLWLNLPLEELIDKMLDPSPEAREMRHVSPFSGVLNAEERARVVRQFRKEYQS